MARIIIDPEVLVSKVVSTYANCQRFRCSATLTRILRAQKIIESHFSMQLAYAAPQKMLLEWWLDGHKDQSHHALMCDGNYTMRANVADLTWRREASIEDALASYAGISNGLALYVPGLLIGYDEFALFERVDHAEVVDRGSGHEHEISGVAKAGINRRVRVVGQNHVIVSIVDEYELPNGSVVCTSEYHDVKIS